MTVITEQEQYKIKRETKVCPYCGGEIFTEAKKCKHCKEILIPRFVHKPDTPTINNNFSKNESTKNRYMAGSIYFAISVIAGLFIFNR